MLKATIHATAFGAVLATYATSVPLASAQQGQTVREFLAACAKGDRNNGCTAVFGGLLVVADFSAEGPFCAGTPPADITKLPSDQFDALTGSVIQWLNTHPEALDRELTAGTLTALTTLYPCKK
jgi:hypothetical protein